MRDPNRIDRMLFALGVLWKTMPDMRFFQLIEYVKDQLPEAAVDETKMISRLWSTWDSSGSTDVGPYRDAFYTEDDITMETILGVCNNEIHDPEQTVVIYFDGGSRGNGSADAIGGWAFIDTKEQHSYGNKVPGATNNEMEWQGLVNALRHCMKRGYTHVHIMGDSQLVVNQFNRKWACKAENLQDLFHEAIGYSQLIPDLEVTWVPREGNPADTEYNKILDR